MKTTMFPGKFIEMRAWRKAFASGGKRLLFTVVRFAVLPVFIASSARADQIHCGKILKSESLRERDSVSGPPRLVKIGVNLSEIRTEKYGGTAEAKEIEGSRTFAQSLQREGKHLVLFSAYKLRPNPGFDGLVLKDGVIVGNYSHKACRMKNVLDNISDAVKSADRAARALLSYSPGDRNFLESIFGLNEGAPRPLHIVVTINDQPLENVYTFIDSIHARLYNSRGKIASISLTDNQSILTIDDSSLLQSP